MEPVGPDSPGMPSPSGVGAADWAVHVLVVATEIVTLEDPQEIARRVVAALVVELGLPVVSILLADEDGTLQYAADHGVTDEVKALGFRRDGTTYAALNTGLPAYVEDVAHDPRANPGTRGHLGAYAALPIHHRGRVYGVIMVTFMEPHAFNTIERVTLSAFAHQIGIALDNGRLHRKERQRIAFLGAQADLAQALSETLDTGAVARILGETLQGTASTRAVAVWTGQGAGLLLGCKAGLDGEPATYLGAAGSRIRAALGGEGLQPVPREAFWEDLGLAPEPGPEAAFAMELACTGDREGLLALLADPENLDPALVRAMGERASLALRNARLYEDSQTAASIDPLTGLLNRRAFLGTGRSLVDAARRTSAPAALIMLDADHFKTCNDTYGHPVGDKVLVLLARILRAHVRPADLVGRLGGEEFAVVLQGASRETTWAVAERIRQAMAASRLELDGGRSIVVPTVSLGLADLASSGAKDLEGLLELADAALYRAKADGRNRTCRAGD